MIATSKKVAPFLVLLLAASLFALNYVMADATKIFIVGDSLTYGLYASAPNKAYRNLVADTLNYDLTWCYAPHLANVAQCYANNPGAYDYVVIEVGLNDVSQPTMTDQPYAQAYTALVNQFQNDGAIVVTATMFHAVSDTDPNYARYLLYNEIIKSSSGDLVADLWTYTAGCGGCLSSTDNFHPSDLGHEKIAEEIINQIIGQNKIYFPIVKGAYP